METGRDRNLLFGILAVQLKGVALSELVPLAAAWANEPSIPLAQRLVDGHLITAEDRKRLHQLVEEAVEAHGGDIEKTLAFFGGLGEIGHTLSRAIDSAELDAIKTDPMDSAELSSGGGHEVSGIEETPGRYTLVSHHATGGMGRVLVVHDEYLGRNIALKELLPAHAPSADSDKPSPVRQTASMVARFLQEARITGQLEHRAIVPVYEVGRRQDGSLYYTMRLVRGKTFSQALHERGRLEERLALLSSFVDLCQAIAYAHSRGVIHRDIKPANIMLGEFGETVVLDWGLAKLRDSADAHSEHIKDTLHHLEIEGDGDLPKTAYGRALGTPHYMPPEQAEGRIDDIDERSDVYSLGAVLYEILTGKTPHAGKSTREIIQKVINAQPTPVCEAASEAPPELAGICERALQKEPENRYQSAVELAEDVERFITGGLVRAYRYSLKEVLVHHYRKHRALVHTAAVCIATLLVVCVASYVSIFLARNREHAQRLVAEEARRDEATARESAEKSAYLAQIRLAQSDIERSDYTQANGTLWETQAALRGWEWAWMVSRANLDAFTGDMPCSRVYDAVFSPDGRRLAVVSTSELPQIWDAEQGKMLVALEGDQAITYLFGHFSPDGSKYVAGGSEGTVCVWDVVSGELLRHVRGGARVYDSCSDTSGAHVFAGCDDGVVRVWNLASGQIDYELATQEGPVRRVVLFPDERRLVTGCEATTQVWDLATRTRLWSVPGQLGALAPEVSVLATIDDPDVRLWNADSGTETARLRGHTQAIANVAFDGAGKRLVSSSFDGSARTWDVTSAQELYQCSCSEPVRYASFVDHDRFVATLTGSNVLALWDIDAGVQLYSRGVGGQDAPTRSLPPSLAADTQRIAIATGEPYFRVWNLVSPPGQTILCYSALAPERCQPRRAQGRMSPDKRLLALGWTGDRGVAVVSLDESGVYARFETLSPYTPVTEAFSPDGSRVAVVLDDFTSLVWDLKDSHLVCTAADHSGMVRCLDFAPDGTQIVSGSWDKTARIWDASTGQTRLILEGHTDTVLDVRFSPNGRTVLTTSADGTANLWSTETGKRLVSFQEHACPVTCGGFSRDGQRVVTAGSNGVAYVWKTDDGGRVATLRIGLAAGSVVEDNQSVSFELDDRYIVTSSTNNPTQIWDTMSYEPLASLDRNDWFHFLVDEHRGIKIDGGGVASAIEVLPWRNTDSKVPAQAAWHDEYRAFKQEQSRHPGGIALPPDPINTVIPIGQEMLVSGFNALRETIEQESPDMTDFQNGIRIGEGPRLAAGVQMALRAGDLITCGEGIRLTTRQEAITWLRETCGRLSQTPSGAPRVTLSRRNRTMIVQYLLLPNVYEEKTVHLTRPQAVDLVRLEMDGAAVLYAATDVLPNGSVSLRIESPRETLEPCALSALDILRGFDGKTFHTGEELQTHLKQLLERIQAGEIAQLSLEIQRGLCKVIKLECVIE